jgi:hypothetical protein
MHFSRTLRALQTQQSAFSVVGMAGAALLLLLWLGWFFLAPVVISVEGTITYIAGDGYVQATFTGAASEQLQRGQHAQLYLDHPADAPIAPIPALVAEVNPQATQSQVDLYAQLDANNADYFAGQPQGVVTVAVERISPALLLLRASGQFVDTQPISFIR